MHTSHLYTFFLLGIAYRNYESWWEDKERSKCNKELETENPNPKAPDINQLLIPRDSYELNQNTIGLGLRAQIPKLPSFRRIRKLPSPIPDEDSRKSDQEDMVRGSDDDNDGNDKEISEIPFNQQKDQSQPAQIQNRKGSTSSFFTSSSEEESSDSDESSDSSLSEVDTDFPKAKIDERQIYSDSSEEADEQEDRCEPENKAKQVNQSLQSATKNVEIYSSEEEFSPKLPHKMSIKRSKSRSKTPEGRNTPIPTNSIDEHEGSLSPRLPPTPGRGSPEEESPKLNSDKKTSDFLFDRLYSDSEDEREYQEKRRKNTEYMEKIERELQEERERKMREQERNLIEKAVPDRAPSPRTPSPPPKIQVDTPTTSLPPPTPGADLIAVSAQHSDPISRYMEKRTSNRIESTDTDTPLSPKAFVIEKDINGTTKEFSKASPDSESSPPAYFWDHCYSLPPSASPSSTEHGHTNKKLQKLALDQSKVSDGRKETRPVGRPRKDPNQTGRSKYQIKKAGKQITNIPPVNLITVPRQMQYQQPPTFKARDPRAEMEILFSFLKRGIDAEDVRYLKRSYEMLLQNEINSYLLNATHWVDHVPTDRSFIPPPPSKKRKKDIHEAKVHSTGAARTEGYYKIDPQEKARYKYHHLRGTAAETHLNKIGANTAAKVGQSGLSREARSNQRRLLTVFGDIGESDLLKFNQLKFRNKQLKFAKSAIHDWGLFAMEPIAADEMVIEYVGQMIRPSLADFREQKYEAIGIGSSYLFRIDLETIIDATKCGNLARFINHSCNVNITLINFHRTWIFYLFFLIFTFSQIAMRKLLRSSRPKKL